MCLAVYHAAEDIKVSRIKAAAYVLLCVGEVAWQAAVVSRALSLQVQATKRNGSSVACRASVNPKGSSLLLQYRLESCILGAFGMPSADLDMCVLQW